MPVQARHGGGQLIGRASTSQRLPGEPRAKKPFNLRFLSQDSGAEKKNIFSRAKNERCAQKITCFEKNPEKPGDLGDLAKSTYNHLVTFDSRGT